MDTYVRFPRNLATVLSLSLLLLIALSARETGSSSSAQSASPSPVKGLQWRGIGPYRGGRVTAVAGVPSQPMVYYFGATGGGVWKTTDGGVNWEPISDGFF